MLFPLGNLLFKTTLFSFLYCFVWNVGVCVSVSLGNMFAFNSLPSERSLLSVMHSHSGCRRLFATVSSIISGTHRNIRTSHNHISIRWDSFMFMHTILHDGTGEAYTLSFSSSVFEYTQHILPLMNFLVGLPVVSVDIKIFKILLIFN